MSKQTRYNNLNVDQIQEQLDRLCYWSSDESEIEDVDNDDDDPIYRNASSSSSSSSEDEEDPVRHYDMVQSLSNPNDAPPQSSSWLEPPQSHHG